MSIIEKLWGGLSTWAMGWGGLAGLVGVILLILWYFTPVFLSSPAAKALLLNVGLGCIAFAFISGYFIQQGYNSCANLIASRDAAAITRARDGVKEIESCRDNGGNWDVVTGTCIKATQ